jgi:phosphoribosyl 1,2-cyclic phosphate phosphodiesterase
VGGDVLIDFGPDTYSHALSSGLELGKMKSVLITHSHSDHFYPEDLAKCIDNFAPVRAYCDFYVYGNDTVVSLGQKQKEAFAGWAGVDRLHFDELAPFKWADIPGARVLPLLASHNPQEHCYVYVIEKQGRRILYSCDSGIYPEVSYEALTNLPLDLAVQECTMLKNSGGKSHCGFNEMRQQKARLFEVGALHPGSLVYISHMYHSGQMTHDDIVRETASDGIQVAYDGLKVEI